MVLLLPWSIYLSNVYSHFDFGLYGSLNGSEYSRNDDEKKAFAYSYFREELKTVKLERKKQFLYMFKVILEVFIKVG